MQYANLELHTQLVELANQIVRGEISGSKAQQIVDFANNLIKPVDVPAVKEVTTQKKRIDKTVNV